MFVCKVIHGKGGRIAKSRWHRGTRTSLFHGDWSLPGLVANFRVSGPYVAEITRGFNAVYIFITYSNVFGLRGDGGGADDRGAALSSGTFSRNVKAEDYLGMAWLVVLVQFSCACISS